MGRRSICADVEFVKVHSDKFAPFVGLGEAHNCDGYELHFCLGVVECELGSEGGAGLCPPFPPVVNLVVLSRVLAFIDS